MPIGAAIGGAAASLFGGIFGAHEAGNAAQAQADAANHATDVQGRLGQEAIDFAKQQYGTQQQNEAPWLKAGQGAVSQLAALLGPHGGLNQQWNQHFQAPTGVTEQNDPGYKFRLSEGLSALNNSAAARGGLLSGSTAKAINNYAQDSASAEFGNVYNRAFGQYQQGYNEFQQKQANDFNRRAALSGIGQVSAGQLGNYGTQTSGNVSNILGNMGNQIGNNINNAGAATASGYIGGANALMGGIGGAVNQIGQYSTLQQLLNNYRLANSSSVPGSISGSGTNF